MVFLYCGCNDGVVGLSHGRTVAHPPLQGLVSVSLCALVRRHIVCSVRFVDVSLLRPWSHVLYALAATPLLQPVCA